MQTLEITYNHQQVKLQFGKYRSREKNFVFTLGSNKLNILIS